MEWLRFYVSTLDNAKVQGLPGGLFKAWVNCLCLARINDGVLPTADVIAFRLRCSTRQAEQWRDDLATRRLLDVMPDGTYRPHDWDCHQYVSDGSTQRVRKHREKQRLGVSGNVSGNVTETPSESESESESDTESDTEQNGASSDSDLRPTHRKIGDAQPADGWRELAATVEQILQRTPTRSGLGRIISATPNGTEAEAIEAIQDAARRGSGQNPKSMSWFTSVVLNYWQDRQRRALPPAAEKIAMEGAEFDRMTDAIELPDARGTARATR